MNTLVGAAVLAVWASPTPTRAEDFVVDGPAACMEFGGEWQGTTTCLVRHLVIGPDDSLIVTGDLTFESADTFYNYGVVEIRTRFQPNGDVHNRGTLATTGLTVNGAPIYNTGRLVNRGWLHNHSPVVNQHIFENEGLLDTCSGAVVNHATMHNTGSIDNWGALIINHGILVHDGSFYNPAGDYRLDNTGAFENRGDIENEGMLTGACGAAYYGTGTLRGNPVHYDACDPAEALQRLISRVFDADSYGADLSKPEALALTAHLSQARKSYELFDDRYSAVSHLLGFIDEVGVLATSARFPRHLGAAYEGWARRIIEILEL